MNYGELFAKAWKIIWRHKVLWIFGILASCSSRTGGGGSNTNFQVNGNRQSFGNIPYQNLPPQWQQFFYNLERAFQNGTIWAYIAGFVGLLIVIGILIGLLFLVLGVFGRVGLIRGAWLADEGAERLTFSSLWNSGAHYFWRVFLFLLVFDIATFILTLIFIIPIILFGVCTLCLGFLVVLAISWFIAVWVELSVVAIVGEDLDVMSGIRRSWDVITHNWGPVILVALIVMIGVGIINLLIGVPFLIVVLPILIAVGAQGQNVAINSLIVAAVLFVLYLPIAIFLYGVVQTYATTVWTLLFRRLTGRTGEVLPAPVAPAAPPAPPVEEQKDNVEIIEPDKTD